MIHFRLILRRDIKNNAITNANNIPKESSGGMVFAPIIAPLRISVTLPVSIRSPPVTGGDEREENKYLNNQDIPKTWHSPVVRRMLCFYVIIGGKVILLLFATNFYYFC
jgi:hypothetical protein